MIDDRSWETPRRTTARLVGERLLPMNIVLPPDLPLRRVTAAWRGPGVVLRFERTVREGWQSHTRQQLIQLSSFEAVPERAAASIADQLLSVAPEDWLRHFEHKSF